MLGFAEKEKKGQPGWINAGIYLMDRRLVSTIPPSANVSLEKDLFPSWIGNGLFGYRSGGFFLDIGTPDSFASASDILAHYMQIKAKGP